MDTKPKILINYLFFGILFCALIFLSIYNIYLIDHLKNFRIFFLFFSFGQISLEIILFLFFGFLIERYTSRKIFLVYTGLVFVLFTLHIVDFILYRIMDVTISDALKLYFFDESIENFVELIHASNIPLKVWFLGGAFLILIPVFGIFFYKLSEKITKKRPIFVKREALFCALFFIPLILFLWDFSASRIIHPDAYTVYLKTIPWKETFIAPRIPRITQLHSLKPPKNEKETVKFLQETNLTLKTKPNLYLFIIESLREDFITPINSPYLADFKKENISFDLSFSNANGTQISWFSLFYSEFPYHWAKHRNPNLKLGSPALQLLKKLGYKIHVYSSAGLGYYNMDQVLFGENHHLVDNYQLFSHYFPTQACESDADTIKTFSKDISDHKDGNLFIFFWDSTHFDYSFPKDEPCLFSPICQEKDYFCLNQTVTNLELIKNSYRNALHFLDSLFGNFQKVLQKNNLWEDALIIVTGDHGEEFYEHGRLFHTSHLSFEQTHVPIYYKFPKNPEIPNSKLTCHMEIFPSIIHYLTGAEKVALFEGDSIFNPQKWNYVFTSRYYAARSPYEFFIHDGQKKVIARFHNQENIYLSKQIKILAVRDNEEKSLIPSENLQEYVQKEFGSALKRIFKKN